MSDKIFLTGMPFFGRHGVFDEETRLGQRFLVTVELDCDLRQAGQADDLALTVNYADVYNIIRTVVEGPPKKLVEAVAEDIASILLREYAMIDRLHVRVEKPGAPIAGVFETVGVEIERSRN